MYHLQPVSPHLQLDHQLGDANFPLYRYQLLLLGTRERHFQPHPERKVLRLVGKVQLHFGCVVGLWYRVLRNHYLLRGHVSWVFVSRLVG